MHDVVDGAEPPLERSKSDGEGRDALTHIVMQVSSDSRALGFLRGDQPTGEIADTGVALTECDSGHAGDWPG